MLIEITLIVIALLLGGLALAQLRATPSTRRLQAFTLMINLKSGQAVQGVCVDETRLGYTLTNATIYEPGAAPAPADGIVMVARSDIAFIQTTDVAAVPRLAP